MVDVVQAWSYRVPLDEWYLGQVSSQRSLEEIPDKPRVFWEALTFAAIIS